MNHSASNSGFSARSKNQRGFSLIEIMVVVGIMAILGLAMSTMMVNSQKEARSVSAKGEFNSLVNLIQGYFNNSNACLAAFGGKAPNKATDPSTPGMVLTPGAEISIKIGSQDVKAGGTYSNDFKITSFKIKSLDDTGVTSQKQLTVRIEADRSIGSEKTAVGGALLAHDFGLLATVNSTGQITGCSGTDTDFWIKANNYSDSTPNITYLAGYVGVAEGNPETPLDVKGTAQANAFMYKSDIRLKENIRDLQSPLERVLKLHGVMFDWKDKSIVINGKDQIGLIAQDVEEVFPEVVTTNAQTGMKSVAYANLVSPLIEALKEQQKIIQDQQQQIEEIKKELAEMKK